MNKHIRQWLFPTSGVLGIMFLAVVFSFTQTGSGLIGFAIGSNSCDDIKSGITVTGILSDANTYDCYEFEADGTIYGATDVTVTITSKSGKPFDADLFAPDTKINKDNFGIAYVTTADNTPNNFNYMLSEGKGKYAIKVWSYSGDVGEYDITVVVDQPLQPEIVKSKELLDLNTNCSALLPAKTIEGSINNNNFDCYSFDAVSGQYVQITLFSVDGTIVDLDLYGPGKEVTADNNGYAMISTSSTANPQDISLPVDQGTGTYFIKVWSYQLSNPGDYQLTLEQSVDTFINQTTDQTKPKIKAKINLKKCESIASAQQLKGSITKNNKYDCYSYEGTAGEILSIEFSSVNGEELDVDIYEPGHSVSQGNTGWEWITTTMGSKSVIKKQITLSGTNGTYSFKPWSYSHVNLGDYNLKVTSTGVDKNKIKPSVLAEFSSIKGGKINDIASAKVDVVYESIGEFTLGSYLDNHEWTFYGKKGQQVHVDLGDDGFYLDTNVSIVPPSQFAKLSPTKEYDNDFTGFNSNVIHTLKETGTYTIVANVSDWLVGKYSLNLTVSNEIEEIIESADPGPTYSSKLAKTILSGEIKSGNIINKNDTTEWYFDAKDGDHVSLTVTSKSPGLMPAVTLMDPAGVISWAEGRLRGSAILNDIAISEDNKYTVLVHSSRGTIGKYDLGFTVTPRETIKPGEKIIAKIPTVDLCSILPGTKGEGVEVAILDTGIDVTHPDLDDLDDDPATTDPKVVLLDSTADWDPTPQDSHGTSVAGQVAGTGTKSALATAACLWGIKVMSGGIDPTDPDPFWKGKGWEEPVLAGIKLVIKGPDNIPMSGDEPDVITVTSGDSSGGNGLTSGALMIDWAVRNGIVVTQSAGNALPNFYTLNSRGATNNGITVGRLNIPINGKDTVDPSSGRGPTYDLRIKPDVVAPGQNVQLPDFNKAYSNNSGTSFATPYVSGLTALIIQKHPGWTPDMVKAAVMNTARPLAGYRLMTQGAGAVDTKRAIDAEVLAIPSSLSFGLATQGSSTSREITISNTGSIDVDVNLTSDTTVYSGQVYPQKHANFADCAPWKTGNDYENWNGSCRTQKVSDFELQLSETSLNIPAGSSTTITVDIGQLDLDDPSGWYEGRVFALIDGNETITVPYIFHHTFDKTAYETAKRVIFPGPGFFCGNTSYETYILNAGCDGNGKLKTSPDTEIDSYAKMTPKYPTNEDEIVVSALISGTVPLKSVVLQWTTDDTFTDIDMHDDGKSGDTFANDSVYSISLGKFPVGTNVAYTISVTDVDGMNVTPNVSNIQVIKAFERHHDVLFIANDGDVGMRSFVFGKGSTPTTTGAQHQRDALKDLGIAYDEWDVILRGPAPEWVLQNYLDGVVVYDAPDMSHSSENKPWNGYESDAVKKFLNKGGNLFASGDNLTQTAFTYDYFNTKDNNTGQGVYTINGISNDVIGDGIRMTTDPSRGFGYALSSDDPITWEPNPFWIQRAVEYGSKRASKPTEFEIREVPGTITEPTMVYDSSALARVSLGSIAKLDGCLGVTERWESNFGGPRDIAVSPSGSSNAGKLYVTDTQNHQLRVLDPKITNKFITKADSNYDTSTINWGAFGTPRDITSDTKGNIYVLDESNTIYKISPAGALLTKWGGCGTENGLFGNASKLAIDDSDNIYVLDTFNMEPDIQLTEKRFSRVHVFDSNGTFLNKWGTKIVGSYEGTDFKNGGLKTVRTGIENPIDIDVDKDGNILIVDSRGMIRSLYANGEQDYQPFVTVTRFDNLGNYLNTPVKGWQSEGKPAVCPNFIKSHTVGTDDSGTIYLDGGGTLNKIVSGEVSCGTITSRYFAVDSSGNVFTQANIINGDNRSTVIKYGPDGKEVLLQGQKISYGSSGTGLGEMSIDLRFHADDYGNLLVLDIGNKKILKFNSRFTMDWELKADTDAEWKKMGSKGASNGEFNTPNGVAVDLLGNIYVADTRNHRIQKFDSDGAFLAKWGTRGTGEGQFDLPMGIDVSPDGSVYVADTFNTRIQKFDSNGKFLLQWESNPYKYEAPYTESFGPQGREASEAKLIFIRPGFTFPKDISVDPDGNVFVSEMDSDTIWGRIQKFSPTGDLLDPAAEYRMGKFSPMEPGNKNAIKPGWALGPQSAEINELSYGGVTVTKDGKVYAGSYIVGRNTGGIEIFEEDHFHDGQVTQYAVYTANKKFSQVVMGLDSDSDGNIFVTLTDKVGSLGSGTAGLTRDDGNSKVVLLGFSLSSVQSRAERMQIMSRSLRYLGVEVGPIPTSPRQGNIMAIGQPVTLEWDPIDGATNYLLEMRNSSRTSNLLSRVSVNGTSYELPKTTPSSDTGWYSWRLKALLKDGNESLWSKPNKFKIVAPASVVADMYYNEASNIRGSHGFEYPHKTHPNHEGIDASAREYLLSLSDYSNAEDPISKAPSAAGYTAASLGPFDPIFSSVVTTKSGKIIAFYSDYLGGTDSDSSHYSSGLLSISSDDDGLTWSSPTLLSGGAGAKAMASSDGTVWLVYKMGSEKSLTPATGLKKEEQGILPKHKPESLKANINLGLGHLKFNLFIIKSTDEGASWTEPRRVDLGVESMGLNDSDKKYKFACETYPDKSVTSLCTVNDENPSPSSYGVFGRKAFKSIANSAMGTAPIGNNPGFRSTPFANSGLAITETADSGKIVIAYYGRSQAGGSPGYYVPTGLPQAHFEGEMPYGVFDAHFLVTSSDKGDTWDTPVHIALGPHYYNNPVGYIKDMQSIYATENGDLWLTGNGAVKALPVTSEAHGSIINNPFGMNYWAKSIPGPVVIKSIDGGKTWGDPKNLLNREPVLGVTVMPNINVGSAFKDAQVVVSDSGKIMLMTTEPNSRGLFHKSDNSTDKLMDAPLRRFTSYVGFSTRPFLTALKDGRFGVLWLSGNSITPDGTYIQQESIKFSVIDHSEPIKAPPAMGPMCKGNVPVRNCQDTFHNPMAPSFEDRITFNVEVADHDKVVDVKLLYSIDGVEQPSLSMTDDANFNGGAQTVWDRMDSLQYGKRTYGVKAGPFTMDSLIKYQYQATDILGNSIIYPTYKRGFEIGQINPFVKFFDIVTPESIWGPNYAGSGSYGVPDKRVKMNVKSTAFDSKGNLYAVHSIKHANLSAENGGIRSYIQKYDPVGNPLAVIGTEDMFKKQYSKSSSPVLSPLVDCEFLGPSKIAIDAEDNLYVTDRCIGPNMYTLTGDVGVNILKFSPEGKHLKDIAITIAGEQTSAAYNACYMAAKYTTGRQWNGDFVIDQISGDFLVTTENTQSPSSLHGNIMRFTSDGACQYNNDKTQFVMEDGKYKYAFQGKYGFLSRVVLKNKRFAELENPQNIVQDKDGIFYIDGTPSANSKDTENRINKYSRDGVLLGSFGKINNTSELANGEFSDATGKHQKGIPMVIGKDGDLYAVDYLGSRIMKFTTDGVYLSKWGSVNTQKKDVNKYHSGTGGYTTKPSGGWGSSIYKGIYAFDVHSTTGVLFIFDEDYPNNDIQTWSPF